MCPHQYTGPTCEQLYNACESSPCHNNATCTTQPPSPLYACQCTPGFNGQSCHWLCLKCDLNSIQLLLILGLNCEKNIDECAQVVCPIGHICIDKINNYECVCPEGWEGDNCEHSIDHCAPNPCHNGSCTSNSKNYTCLCDPGYSGRNCDIGMSLKTIECIHCLNVDFDRHRRMRVQSLRNWHLSQHWRQFRMLL